MNYKAVSIETNQNGIESVTGRLYTIGISGVEIKECENSNKVFIKTCIEENAQTEGFLKDIEKSMEELKNFDTEKSFGSLKISVETTSDEEWSNAWKKYYKPTKIGRNLVIVPEWEKYDKKSGDVIVKVEPGSAFGSGTHETTSLCLEYIEDFAKKSSAVLDIGTGTGILAVTALKLGVKSAVATDIDKGAVEAAKVNAELNDVSDKLSVFVGDLTQNVQGKFDLITANIVADAIISLAPFVGKFLTPNGIFVASGIIRDREEEVRKALSDNKLCVFNCKYKKNWVALACKRI